MKTNLSKRMRLVTSLTIFFGVLNMFAVIVQATRVVGLWSEPPLAKWNDDILGLQVAIFAGTLAYGIVMNLLIMLFMHNSIKLIRNGEFFSKRNAKILWWTAPTYLIGSFCDYNAYIICQSNADSILIYPNSFLIPTFLIGISIVYSIGVILSEENRLTV